MRRLLQCIFLVTSFVHLDCEPYQDRPKIKTSDGDLILEPAYNKNVYLLPNGPKSSIFVGEVNILNAKTKQDKVQNAPTSNDDLEGLLNGPSEILRRLEKLESKTPPQFDDIMVNITMLWRRVNNLHRKVHTLQLQMADRGKDNCASQPCQHGGTCLNIVNGYHCLCPSNWEGQDCDVDVNECRNFIGTDLGCQNGATCINKPGYYECLCRPAWYGLHCTRRLKDCSGGDFEMCGHGTCVVGGTEGVTCICHQGWTTNGTGVACLTDVNECDAQQGARCSVNPKVECINLPGSFRCGRCPPGYDGDGFACADIDECVTIPNGGCSPMVACHNTIGSRICGPCPPGYQGDGVTCTWRGSCNINHGGCHPSAQCIENISLGQTAQCICPDGMDGDGVGFHGCYVSTGANDTDNCANNPCGPHGQCHALRSGFTCLCQRGYGGARCDALGNFCSVNPCHNRGICHPDYTTTTGFRCECTAEYSGPLCQVRSRSCGSLLDAEEGSIIYPLSNSTYNHNSRCAWVIHTVSNKVINVTFSKFNLEEDAECMFDFLQIHDGRSSASQLIGRFCGNTFPRGGNIISSHNNLYLWFRTDGTVAKEGFALHWTSIDPVCGGEVDATTHGHISSPGSPGRYPPNRDCFWHLASQFGKRVQLHFFALDIEKHPNCSFDYLAIYDGMKTTDPLLNIFCNSSQPAPITSAGSEILIHFHSDASGSGNGFQIAYAPVEGVPGCGGYFTADRGELVSPSYNGTSMNQLLCEYKIKTSPGTIVKIDFKQFKLESSIRCRFDYLKIYDGPTADSPLVGKFCGSTYPKTYTATTNMLFLKFKTDITVPSEGFKIFYEALCQYTLVGDSGFITSPGYPFVYPENRVCEYIIRSIPGKAILLTFQDFDIEDNTYYDCQYDNVEIRDGVDRNATLLGRYCGSSHMPPDATSSFNYMYVRFQSDMSISGTGFYANYTTVDVTCGGIHRETTGLINYPPTGDSTTYENDQSCTWLLIAPPAMHIKLTWNRFEIEHMPSCDSDSLEIIEIDQDGVEYSMGKFCGTNTPPALTTSTNRLRLQFTSDSSVRSAGFSVSYTFLDEKSHCGGYYYRNHGYIYSPGWPGRYETNKDCTWTITVPAGQQIKLNISHFELERSIRGKCDHGDYLEIRNGVSQNAALIGQYCGKFDSKIITSLANTLYIRFHSDYYLTGNGFKLEWDGSVTGCGGTLSSSFGSISSPNYPENYNENSECFYRIVTSLGSRIRISFTDLDLERTTSCRDDYIEIFDGRDTGATSLGRHCYISPGLNNIETSSNYAFIKFHSDSYITGKGFLLNYFTICNNNITGRYGVIESPDYPSNYPTNLNCEWNINVPKGNKINVTFTDFDVFRQYYRPYRVFRRRQDRWRLPGGCDEGYLEWRDTSVAQYSEKYCGTNAPPKFTTQGNGLQIRFNTGGYGGGTGFRLEWVMYGCGGHIQKRYGTLSLDRVALSSEELECEWLIETPDGTSISLSIDSIYIEETKNCTTDAVEIYNGPNTKSPLLSRICNHQQSRVQSSANLMLVRFVKHSNLKGVYFTSTFSTRKSSCGGSIRALSGYIYSKNYPKNYDDNVDCIWYISVPNHHRIKFNFMDLDLYSNVYNGDDDCGDSIKIYGNMVYLSDSSNYTYRICPKSDIRSVTISDAAIIQFTSDSFGNAKGFKINYTVTCGASIKAVHDGIISNEEYVVGTNETCVWVITAPQLDQKISLTITHMNLPRNEISNRTCASSYLRVYDGEDITAPLIDEYCGRKVPPMIVSRGNVITVLLASHSSSIAGYFSAYYTTVSETCGGTITSEEGTIASPNYPRAYPIGANCEWVLSTAPGNSVYLTFEQFELEYSEGCNEDYLEIRENNGGGRLLGVYCGDVIPTNTTTAARIYIKFHSNDKYNTRGFMMHYGFLHGNDLIDMETGEIASPLYPHKFHGSGEYSWRVLSKGPTPMAIWIDVLEIHSYSETCYNKLAVYDGYDESAPLLIDLCGKLQGIGPQTLQTSSNMAFIKLSMDESNSGARFHLTWKKTNINDQNTDDGVKINCGSNYTEVIPPGNHSVIQSPHYPNDYDNDLNCEWTYEAAPGRHLQLIFDTFQLEEANRCFNDYVSVYSSDNREQWKPVKENICETKPGTDVMHSSKFMKVIFKTDPSVTKRGFHGRVNSMCGGLITDLSGEVGLDFMDISGHTMYKINCEWTVKVRPGRLIELRFIHFNITNTGTDCLASVTLKNGDSVEAPFLGNGLFCGFAHENRELLTTTSNSFFISYTTNIGGFNNRAFQNFKIRYEEKNIECGGTSKLEADQAWEVINSPNYPSVPSPFSECVWRFTGPPGEILRIDFIDRFDLDTVDDCGTEVVEIRDGLSELAPLKGRFCRESPSTIKTSSNTVYIKYLTQLNEPRNGFKANVTIDTCGGTIVAENGEFKSPGYPHLGSLPQGTNCTWRIRGTPRFVFTIIPRDIDLPEPETPCATKISIQEKLPANDTLIILRDFCYDDSGEYDKAPIVTSTNEIIITYQVGKPNEWRNNYSNSKGFRFTFNSSRPACGGMITEREGYITTPGYPIDTSIRYCQWNIHVPDKTRKVKLELLDLDAEKHTIGIYNDLYTLQSIIETIDGKVPTTRVFESSGNKMALFLWLHPLQTRHRFKAKFSSDEAALCGGELTGVSGELSSPNLNRSYTCEWQYSIKTEDDDIKYNTIVVNAQVNSSVARSRCRFNDPKLVIRSTITKRGLTFYRDMCGNAEKTIMIPSSAMDVKALRTKRESLYFHLDWKVQPCGGVINVGEEPVNVLETPSDSNETLNCAWLLSMPFNTRIQLKMEGAFQYDCDDEYIKIGQGLSQNALTIGDYCKTRTMNEPLLANFRYIFVDYHAKSKNASSFKLMVNVIKNQCGGQLTTTNYGPNVFMSPNFPKNYESNQECAWSITTELGSRISLKFIDRFVVESRPNCTKDAVIIYDWKNDDYNEIARLCGRELPPIYNSTHNRMKVVLRTDATTNMDGFKASWSTICGGTFVASEKVQLLYSPGYPFAYPSMSDCVYKVTAPEGKKLLITFIDFELEGSYPECEFDNVTIDAQSNNNYYYNVYCGTEFPSVISSYETATIKLKTDRYVQRQGFKLSYTVFTCGGQITEPTVISSHHGDSYDNDVNCTWSIQAPEGKKVVLNFQFIDLENHYSCYNDYIAVFDGRFVDENRRLALMCGNINSTTTLTSHGNSALLQFVTDSSYTFKGFKVQVSFTYSESVGCGGNIDLTSSTMKSFNSFRFSNKTVYEHYLHCEWHITSPPDTVVKIEFVAFHVSSCAAVNQTALGISKCDCDYVDIKDGVNPDSFRMGKYCGHTLPQPLLSSGNLMSVILSTDGDEASSGFDARLSVLPSVCGQSRYTVSDTAIRIKSPGFDTAIPRGIHCVYHFDGEHRSNAMIQLTVRSIDLQPPSNEGGVQKCINDKVIIANNKVSRNVSIGKDYIINHSPYSFFNSYVYFSSDVPMPKNIELCGSSKPSDLYLTGSVTVTLMTSPVADSLNHKGVEFEVVFVGFCGRNYTGTQGKVQNLYQQGSDDDAVRDCYTLITAPENHTISAYFLSITPDYWNENTYLDIYDGKTTSATKLVSVKSEYDNNLPQFSTGRYMLLHGHKADGDHVYYDMNYMSTDKGRGCGGRLVNEMGKVTSPMYPDIYRAQSSCEWELETPIGTRLRLHFAEFALGNSCDQNYVELVSRAGAVERTYCAETPADYQSTDNYVKIVFHTTMNNGGTGWVAEFVGMV